jgi:hypothetical protein
MRTLPWRRTATMNDRQTGKSPARTSPRSHSSQTDGWWEALFYLGIIISFGIESPTQAPVSPIHIVR